MIENRLLRSLIQVVLVLLVLFILIMSGVRLLLTDAFLQIEYRMPNFPEDEAMFIILP